MVGPVRRGRGRRLRVERRVLPVTADENRRIEVFERELWRIAVEHLDYGEQVQWAALAGARVAPTGWRRARAMLHFDQGGELKRTFLTTAVERNKNPQLRLKALQEVAAGRDAEAFDRALDFVETWPRDDKREGVKVVLQALAEKKIGRRDQANNWIWRCANMTREVHEEYAVQRWPETKRLLGLLVNSSGGAHARNARRLVHAARQQDRRLAAALLAAALPHTAEAGEVVNGARTRMSRKPAALARELLRNFPKGRGKSKRRRRRKPAAGEAAAPEVVASETVEATTETVPEAEAERRRPSARARGGRPPPRRSLRPRAARTRPRRRSGRGLAASPPSPPRRRRPGPRRRRPSRRARAAGPPPPRLPSPPRRRSRRAHAARRLPRRQRRPPRRKRPRPSPRARAASRPPPRLRRHLTRPPTSLPRRPSRPPPSLPGAQAGRRRVFQGAQAASPHTGQEAARERRSQPARGRLRGGPCRRSRGVGRAGGRRSRLTHRSARNSTSPASTAMTPPSSRRTSRRPASSIPAPTPTP